MRNLPSAPEIVDASGVFETCRVRGGRVLNLNAHLDRLAASLRTVGIPVGGQSGLSLREVARRLREAAREIGDGFVRAAVRRGAATCPRASLPAEELAAGPQLLLYRSRGVPYCRRQVRKGLVLRTVPTRAPGGERAVGQAKISQRLSGILARWEGGSAPEALRLGPEGHLTEGTASNLFFVKAGCLFTPPPWAGVLEGVTRARVIRAARRLGLSVMERPFSRHELFNAEEAFLTNVLMPVYPVREVDGRAVGRRVPGPVTERLLRAVEAA